jgi:DNA-binding response OmpR family regulator
MAIKTRSNFNIVIVSENTNFRNVLSSKFRMENFDVEIATGGFHLLHLLEKEKGVNLIIFNGDMPDMTAFESITLIRDTKSKLELPILFIVKNIKEVDIAELISKGIIDFHPQTTDFNPIIERAQKYFHQMKLIAA